MNNTNHQRPLARRIAVLWCVIAAAIGGVCIAADETGPPTTDAAAVQPFVSETTFLVVKFDFARAGLPQAADALQSLPPDAQEAYQQWLTQIGVGLEWLRTTADGQIVYASVSAPIYRYKAQWPIFLFLKSTSALSAESLRERWNLSQGDQVCARGEFVVASPVLWTHVSQLLDSLPPAPREEVSAAFDAVGDYPVQVLLLPPAHVRRTVQELMPQLPAQLGGGPSGPLTDGLGWAALGFDTVHLRAELIVQSASEDAAHRFGEYMPQLLQGLYEAVPGVHARVSPEAAKLVLSQIKPHVEGSRITVSLDGFAQNADSLRLLTTAVQAIQTAIDRKWSADRFKQLLLAMHNYHDVYKTFPPRNDLRDAKGRTKLSWRVHLLPFLDEGKLYDEFHLDEAWDSPHNRPLLEKMPAVFRSSSFDTAYASAIPRGYTTFVAPVGEDTIFGGTKSTSFRDIWDGTSNTIALVEVQPELAVPWTAPQDYAFDPNAPTSGMRRWPDGRFQVAFVDSSVRELPADLEPAQFLGMSTKAKFEIIGWDEIK